MKTSVTSTFFIYVIFFIQAVDNDSIQSRPLPTPPTPIRTKKTLVENSNDEELIKNDRDYVTPRSSSVSNVKKHLKIGNPASLKRQCNLCKKKFKMNEFKKHIQLKGQKDHRCCICNKVFANRLSTYAHIREVHKGKKKKTLNISSKNATKSNDFQRFTCIFHNTCGETFKTDEELEDHVQEKHPDAKLSKEDINELFLARYKGESKRLMTFMNCWPNPVISPEKLAHAGFIFTRRGDNVQCAFCAGVLGDWEETDDPMTVHKESFPECSKVIKNAKKSIKSGPKVGKRKTKITKKRRRGSSGLILEPITKHYKCQKCSFTFDTYTAGLKHVSEEHEIQVQFPCDYFDMYWRILFLEENTQDETIVNALKPYLDGKSPGLQCDLLHEISNPVLYQISICFDKEFNIIGCEKSAGGIYEKCKESEYKLK